MSDSSNSNQVEFTNDNDDVAQDILRLQNKLSNMKTFIGVAMGMLMIIYFFTFATLIDHGLKGAVYFELFSSIAFIFGFIFLNRLGYWLLLRRFSSHSVYGPLLNQIDQEAISQDATELAANLRACLRG